MVNARLKLKFTKSEAFPVDRLDEARRIAAKCPKTAADTDYNFDVLEYLRIPKNGSVLIRIDRPVRDYLISRLSERH